MRGPPNIFLLVAVLLPYVHSSDKLVLYRHSNQKGDTRTLTGPTYNLKNQNFNDEVSSVHAVSGAWEMYSNMNYDGWRMTIAEGQKSNVDRNDHYTSARPICSYTPDPSRFKLRVYEHNDYQGDSKDFTDAEPDLDNDWDNEISSVQAVKGDWELYEHEDYAGLRIIVREGEWKNVHKLYSESLEKTVTFNDKATSLRPICSSYREKAACKLDEIEVVDDGREAAYDGTEIIGSAWDGTCTSPDGTSHTLSIGRTDSVEESFGLTISEEEEINWSVTASVEISAEAGFLGSGSSVTAGISVGVGGSKTTGVSEEKSFSSSAGSSSGSTTAWTPPGSSIIFGVVDRFTLDLSDAPVKMHMSCPDGSKKVVESTMALTSTTYGSAKFYPFVGSFTEEACAADPSLHLCTQRVQDKYVHDVADFHEIYNEVDAEFKACFADGKGTVS